MANTKETVLLNLRSVTQSCKGGVPLYRLERDYKVLCGTSIPYADFGYPSFEAFIRSIPDVISLQKKDGQIMAEGIADAATEHLVSLVNRQKQTKPVKSRKYTPNRRGGFSSRFNYRGDRGYSYSSSRVNSFTRSKSPVVHHSEPSQSVHKVSNYRPPPAAPKAPVPPRKYERPPRFQKEEEKRKALLQQRPASPPVSTSPHRISPASTFHDRTLPTVSSMPVNDYSSDQYMQSPRPLLPSRTVGRVDRLKQLDAAASAKEYIEIYSRMNNVPAKYSTTRIGQKKKSRGYISNLILGQKTYISYPELASTEEEAEEFAAMAAVEAIRKEHLETLPETSVSTAGDIGILLDRIEELVYEKPSGMFTNGIVHEYENKFNESLPDCWLDLLRQSSRVEIEEIDVPYGRVPNGVNCIVRPTKSLSSGSTTPSEPCSKLPTELQEFENDCRSSQHILEEKPLFEVPQITIPVGNEWEVFITNISNYVTVRLIDYDANFLKLSTQMSTFYETHSLPVHEAFEKQRYAALSSDADGNLIAHRVLAHKILEDDWIECYYVDEGVYSEVMKSDLQELRENFLALPFQAVHLALDSLEEFEDFIKTEDLEFLLFKCFIAVVRRWCKSYDDDLPDDPGILRTIFSVTLYDTSGENEDICLNNSIKETVLKSLTCTLPKLGVSTRGYLTHVTETGEIFLRFLHPEESLLEIVLAKLFTKFEEACSRTISIPPGKMCVAKFDNDNWYRATVSENSSYSNDSEHIAVFFIDYGHTSIVKKSEVCELEPHSEFLTSLGSQAVKCELCNALPFATAKWTVAATNKLIEYAPFTEELIVRVISEGDQNTLSKVNLYKRLYTPGDSFIISINDNLAGKPELFCDGSTTSVDPAPLKVPSKLNLQHNTAQLLTRSYLSSNATNGTSPTEENLSNSVRKMDVTSPNEGIEWLMTPDNIKSPEAYDEQSRAPLQPPQVPEEGQLFDIFVTIAATPHNFTVQPLQSAAAMDKLRIQMQQFYSTEDNIIEMPLSLLKRNSFYAALHSDLQWYRVRIQTIVPGDPMQVVVYYVDFGDYSTVNMQNLQILWNQFRNLPCQAIKASLAGIKPVEVDWNPIHCIKFREMVTEKKFVSIVQRKYWKDEQEFSSLQLEVTLVDTSDAKKDIYVNEVMIDMLMAQRA